MQLDPHLSFNGDCEAAFQFYEKCLGGNITFIMPYEGSPMASQVPAAWRNKVLHATLKVGDRVLTGADVPPDQDQKPAGFSMTVGVTDPEGFSITIGVTDPAEAERVFQALSENGTVRMPLQETFWAIRFGMLVDRFGIPWMINCGKAA
jgi:PhnB protein